MAKKPKRYFFTIQGSSAQPYKVCLTLEPLTISCTCTAAWSGQPCKHRIGILNGQDIGFGEAPENYQDILQKAAEQAARLGVPEKLELLQGIKALKQKLAKITDTEFKKYKEALLSQKNEKTIIKTLENMNMAIAEEAPAYVKLEEVMADIHQIFISRGENPSPDVSRMAQDALS
jgi:hypothetical protein